MISKEVMKKIIDYELVSVACHTNESLALKIKKRIPEGWQPFGNLTSTNDGEMIYLYQPIVKYEERNYIEKKENVDN